jgi:hypothetical protein
MSDTLIQSYVWHEGKCFFVSTINRVSSAELAYGGTYAETLVWEYDYEERKRGNIVGQTEGSTGSISAHIRMCQLIHETGLTEEKEDDQ